MPTQNHAAGVTYGVYPRCTHCHKLALDRRHVA
jgi:hypothetical protein